ncbi:MAG: large conductance mechanosensitive channel protein MscL [Clostridia bacterium]|nr:large conductance mechanosensitive channel protein MscL [Clostridia bacterium]
MSKKNGKKSFATEFKEFVMRGNVMDMAIGVIIGGAFTAIVNSLVGDILTPILGLFTKGINFSQLIIPLGDTSGIQGEITPDALNEANIGYIAYGKFIQAIITFIVIALVVFLIIKIIKAVDFKAKKAAAAAEAEAAAKKAEEERLAAEAAEAAKALIKICPFCLSEINVKATRCPHCTSQLGE